MNWLFAWLGIGVVTLVVLYGRRWLSDVTEHPGIREIRMALDPRLRRRAYRLRRRVVEPAFAAVLIVAGWPVVVFTKTRAWLERRRRVAQWDQTPEHRFAVGSEDLRERLTVQQIEQREVVRDPLGAVSTLPFGHLNGAWRAFLAEHADRGELWSFTARWRSEWGEEELRTGYVVVEDGMPGPWMLSGCKVLAD